MIVRHHNRRRCDWFPSAIRNHTRFRAIMASDARAPSASEFSTNPRRLAAAPSDPLTKTLFDQLFEDFRRPASTSEVGMMPLGAVGRSCKGRHERGRQCAKSAHFVSTVIFSLQLHKLHSKARTSRPSGPDTKPVNIIGPWHFGHGGRSMRPG
jgi:hypothetical protein